jgi:spore photoproduct lyase
MTATLTTTKANFGLRTGADSPILDKKHNFDFKTIYYDLNIGANKKHADKANSIIAKFPNAKVKRVNSHWNIEELNTMDPELWMKIKRDFLVLGIKKDLKPQDNGRSSDYIAASHANGCLSGCTYCYVARRKGSSNPLTIFLNNEELISSLHNHQLKLGKKKVPNQCDPLLWTYDLGNNNDCSIDAMLTSNMEELILAFAKMEHAKATFATKTVNEKAWLSINPLDSNGVTHTRIRYSLMPDKISKLVDINTSPISNRIKSINNLVEAGYEVHVNFSPVILYDKWQIDWKLLFDEINDTLTDKAKSQLKCEVIYLTHDANLHLLNEKWHPEGEKVLWSPENQRIKINKPNVICYDYKIKAEAIESFKRGIAKFLPYCSIRYIF